jgi:DNA-binding beta-propeller fold protein YncE
LRLSFRNFGAFGLAMLMLGAAVSVVSASDVTGHVYVNDNTAGENTIAAFDRHGDGSLTPIAGSPFAAGGQDTGISIGSQGALQVSGDGRYLLAVDAGSNQISVLRVRPDGALARVQGSPVYSGGFDPISIAVHDNLVYVANEAAFKSGGGIRPFDARLDPSGADLYVVDSALDAVSAFAVSGGSLSELPGSAFALPAGATPFGIVAI